MGGSMPVSSLVMMALGTFRFGVNQANYQKARRVAAFRWQKQDRIGRAPALQYLGPDAMTMTLEGEIYPHFKGGLRQVEGMMLVAGLGQPMMLVDGLGWVWRRWAITGVEDERTLFMADGAPRAIEFTLSLQAYGRDLL